MLLVNIALLVLSLVYNCEQMFYFEGDLRMLPMHVTSFKWPNGDTPKWIVAGFCLVGCV